MRARLEPSDGHWGPRWATSGTVSSVSGSTVAIAPIGTKTPTTVDLTASTAILSATQVASSALASGDDAIVDYSNGPGSTASEIIFADQSLSSLGIDCWPFLPPGS
jgi:hypothetical protein